MWPTTSLELIPASCSFPAKITSLLVSTRKAHYFCQTLNKPELSGMIASYVFYEALNLSILESSSKSHVTRRTTVLSQRIRRPDVFLAQSFLDHHGAFFFVFSPVSMKGVVTCDSWTVRLLTMGPAPSSIDCLSHNRGEKRGTDTIVALVTPSCRCLET